MDKMKAITEAMHKEKDPKTRNRLLAVRAVLLKHPTAAVASMLDVDQRTVQLWAKRYDERGTGGLRDAARPGHRPKVPFGRMEKIALRLYKQGKLTPKRMCRRVRNTLNIDYSVGSMRRILRALGFSRKTSVTKLADAVDAQIVKEWQGDTKRKISNAKRRGFRIGVQDDRC